MPENDLEPCVTITASIVDRITFASHQNDVPVIADLLVENPTEQLWENLVLRLVCEPPLVASKTWAIDRLNADGVVRLRDRKVSLGGALLSDLNERLHAEIHLTLHKGDAVIAEHRQRLTGLARHEWGGASSMPELLAAFVMPNDPTVDTILKQAAEILRLAGENPAIDGYQGKSRTRVWQLVSAIWTAICAHRIVYASPPASFEREGQKIRAPNVIWDTGIATCLDTATLFAAAIEQAGLYPMIALTEGHALCGVWLQPQNLPALTTDDAGELRKYTALNELILFETTLATSAPPATFSQAIAEGARRISEKLAHEFVYALDIRQARSRQISPLGVSVKHPIGVVDENKDTHVVPGLETAPALPAFDLGINDGPAPDTPETRLDHWKRKLLDLTKRNRLLNLQYSKNAIPMICPDPAAFEDMLAAGKKIAIIPMADLGHRDGELLQDRTGEDFTTRFALDALERHELVADLSDTDLKSGLVELYRKARSDLQEGGENTLFLALGMLRWKQNEQEDRVYRAPLLLIPVSLERQSAAAKIRLIAHDDAPVFNTTLLEMLRQDFDLRIPELEGALPGDEAGIDVRMIWDIMRRAIRDIKHFEVVEEIVLSTFSFAKFLMWEDLSERTEALKTSPFVHHLIERPKDAYTHSSDFLRPDEIDRHINPSDLYMPLTADSSQIVAVHASSQGGDFILEGPPGTGKSQTIANIIAHNLGLGRKILFVSEKMAALKVVHERLCKHGLGDFCLELHSNKTSKKEVLGQLHNSWRNRQAKTSDEWQAETRKLQGARDDLNRLVLALHTPGRTGISPRAAMGTAIRFGAIHRLTLDWVGGLENDRAHDAAGLERLTATARMLGQLYQELDSRDFTLLATIGQTEWSYAWQACLVDSAVALKQSVAPVTAAASAVCLATGLSDQGIDSVNELTALQELTTALLDAVKHPVGFILMPDATAIVAALDNAAKLLLAYRETKAKLSLAYSDQQINDAPVAQWHDLWVKATASSWPMATLRKRSVVNAVVKLLTLDLPPKLDTDLSLLATLQDINAQIHDSVGKIASDTPWRGHATNLDDLQQTLVIAQRLRAAVTRYSPDAQQLIGNREVVKNLLGAGRDLLAPGMPIATSVQTFIKAQQDFTAHLNAYRMQAGADGDLPDSVTAIRDISDAIVAMQSRINAWCRWQTAVRDATGQGLGCLVTALQNQTVPPRDAAPAFHTAYCTWLAPRLIDSRRELGQFSATSHEDKIAEFRTLDQKVAKISTGAIRARLSENIPRINSSDRTAGYRILSKEIQKKSHHKPVRELVQTMGDALTDLTPCLMMSPLSVAQFLPADNQLFDLVVFDEASQITVWDAIGAIARGKNVIIVGDPKQMPPTSFFDRATSANADDTGDIEDLESILDEGLATGVKLHRLTGHYRSRHESLITFSNHRYYGGELITYPSAETRQSVVSFVNTHGLYQRGSGRTNPVEAKAVVDDILRRLHDPVLQNQSLGIVALNSEQQKLIADLLDQERRKDPSLEQFFNDDRHDTIFIKNLETVQGDERDVILLSIGYGPDTPGAMTMSMNFGPLNRNGGERRLNVAITRATSEMVVFASFDPTMIDLTRTSAAAVRDLKHYLEFAQRGPAALGEAVLQTGGLDSYDSDFEQSVATGLRNRGWNIHTQIGVSKFRIDLGVVHPQKPGKYLAGIECDGAAYHSSPSARDRDRVRHDILVNLNWQLLRIWSTDYFIDPTRVLDKVHARLQEMFMADQVVLVINKPIDGDAQLKTLAISHEENSFPFEEQL